EQGKNAALLTDSGELSERTKKLAETGYSAMSIDWIGVGEFSIENRGDRARMNNEDASEPWQKYAAYTSGYNHPIFDQRVHDVLTGVALVKESPKWEAKQLQLIGTDGSGAHVAAARFMMGNTFMESRTIIDF